MISKNFPVIKRNKFSPSTTDIRFSKIQLCIYLIISLKYVRINRLVFIPKKFAWFVF